MIKWGSQWVIWIYLNYYCFLFNNALLKPGFELLFQCNPSFPLLLSITNGLIYIYIWTNGLLYTTEAGFVFLCRDNLNQDRNSIGHLFFSHNLSFDRKFFFPWSVKLIVVKFLIILYFGLLVFSLKLGETIFLCCFSSVTALFKIILIDNLLLIQWKWKAILVLCMAYMEVEIIWPIGILIVLVLHEEVVKWPPLHNPSFSIFSPWWYMSIWQMFTYPNL